MHPYVASQLANDRHQEMIARASQQRLAREASAAKQEPEPQARRARRGIRIPVRLRARVA